MKCLISRVTLCGPVVINNTERSCLLWADDLFVVSQSAVGLQNATNKVEAFYASLGLQVNCKKTKVMKFNKAGKVLYGCEVWHPYSLPKKCFIDESKLLSCWESLNCETLNQYCSQILLSVHKKASRLAVLGDLGRYPMAVRAMVNSLNYRLCLESKPQNSLLGHVMTEMKPCHKMALTVGLVELIKCQSY